MSGDQAKHPKAAKCQLPWPPSSSPWKHGATLLHEDADAGQCGFRELRPLHTSPSAASPPRPAPPHVLPRT